MILPHSQSPVPVPALPGITRRTLVHGTAMMICEFSLKAGSNLPIHSHPHEQAGYLVSGKIRLTVGTETQELGPGGTYYAAPNVPHGAVVLEDAVVVDTFSPPREDYLTPPSRST
jgi:quercetin dioxygenase-like cupin family protein